MKKILNIICTDSHGIVAAVSNCLNNNNAFIVRSDQFSDSSTGTFFMRVEFEGELSDGFEEIAQRFDMDYNISEADKKSNLLVMASKEGHCLSHILNRWREGALECNISAIASNHKDLEDMAAWYDIPFYHISADDKAKSEAEIEGLMGKYNIDLLVLARYMQILSDKFCDKFSAKAINIHHSFLPSFKGANPYKQAFQRGVKIIGATAHYITKDLDEGPIISQNIHRVDHSLTVKELKQVGKDVESVVLTSAVKKHIEHKVLLNGNKTVVF